MSLVMKNWSVILRLRITEKIKLCGDYDRRTERTLYGNGWTARDIKEYKQENKLTWYCYTF